VIIFVIGLIFQRFFANCLFLNLRITMSLPAYKQDFLELALAQAALQFGDFTLKSGRKSPYFFNMNVFADGACLMQVARCYQGALEAQFGAGDWPFAGLFGPAYKGIPLATALAVHLAQTGRNFSVSFNRKEQKSHGDAGWLLGAPLPKTVLLVDDVLTAGTAVRESLDLLKNQGVTVVGLLVALDRQEQAKDRAVSARTALQADFGLPVFSILQLTDVLTFAEARFPAHLQALQTYRATYAATC
jgi:orotate phosphoribosyltransferase